MKRLRGSDVKKLAATLHIDKKSVVEEDEKALLVNKTFSFFKHEGKTIPALPLLLQEPDRLPTIIVDMGAVPHVARGADIMRPGITSVPDAHTGDAVVIVDEKNKKPLAVGLLLFSGKKIEDMSEGRVVQTLHYVGDELWKQYS